MYIVNLTKYNITEEFVLKDEPNIYDIEDLVEAHFVSMKDAAEFYTNREQYMSNIECNIEILKYPRIWFLVTDARGYDTYDSGVFIAWTENRAREIAEEISGDFKKAHVECIGVSNKVQEECVCSSFNAG